MNDNYIYIGNTNMSIKMFYLRKIDSMFLFSNIADVNVNKYYNSLGVLYFDKV